MFESEEMKNERIIESIKDEFYEHGELINTLNILDVIFKIKTNLKEKPGTTLDQFAEGITRACEMQVRNNKYYFPIRRSN